MKIAQAPYAIRPFPYAVGTPVYAPRTDVCMKLTLEVTSFQARALKETSKKEFSTAGGTLGRVVDNTWVLPDPERFLSSKHAQILSQAGEFHIKDTSTNGVFINRSAQPLGKGNSVRLNDGDVFRCGEYEFVARIEMHSATPVPDNDPFAFEVFEHRDIDPFADDGEVAAVTSQGEIIDPLKLLGDDEPEAQAQSIMPEEPATVDDAFRTPEDHSSAMNDAFTPPRPLQDETPFVAPEEQLPAASAAEQSGGQAQIPEDWDKTGFSLISPVQAKRTSESKSPAKPKPKPASPTQPKIQKPAASQRNEPPILTSDVSKPVPRAQSYSGGSHGQTIAAFFRGLGLSEDYAGGVDEQQTMELTGRLMREMLQGLIKGLEARSEIKSELRISQTVIRPVENNPLKFSADIDDALVRLFGPPQQGYLNAEDAIRDGLNDMAEHQMALMVGMQAAYRHLLTEFSPQEIRAKQKQGRGSGNSVFKKSQAWSDYCDYHAQLVRDFDKSFQRLFGDALASAYEEHVHQVPPDLPPTS